MAKLMLAILVVSVTTVGLAQSKKQAAAQEERDLSQLILRDDKEVGESIRDYGLTADSLAKGMSVKRVDLDQDGQPEYIVGLSEEHLCGAHANCPYWVYRRKGGQYQLLLRTFGQQLLLEKTSTNRFRDLRSEGSDSAFETSFTIYKFDGDKFQARGCYTRTYAPKGRRVKVIRRKCEEAE